MHDPMSETTGVSLDDMYERHSVGYDTLVGSRLSSGMLREAARRLTLDGVLRPATRTHPSGAATCGSCTAEGSWRSPARPMSWPS